MAEEGRAIDLTAAADMLPIKNCVPYRVDQLLLHVCAITVDAPSTLCTPKLLSV